MQNSKGVKTALRTSCKLLLLGLVILGLVGCSASNDELVTPTPTSLPHQGIKGDVVITAGVPGIDPRAGSNLEVIANEPGTSHLVAHTFSGADGQYTLYLSPGTYDVCVNSGGIGVDRPCTTNVTVRENQFIVIHLGVAMQ